LRKTPISRRKLSKIAENCNHNIDPWKQFLLQFFPRKNCGDNSAGKKIAQKMNQQLVADVPVVDGTVSKFCSCKGEEDYHHQGRRKNFIRALNFL
jgi:hypothetical protein